MNLPFIVYALPRSRTAWMAKFLSYNEWQCGHEQAIFMRSVYDIKRLFSLNYTGVVETAAAQGWRIIKHHVPHIRQVVVKRPIEDVMKSMVKTAEYDVPRLRKVMEYGNRMLDEISGQPGVLTLDFDSLGTMEGCAALFEHCLPYRFDSGWWKSLKGQNIQLGVPEVITYYHEHKPEIEAFKSAMWREMRALRRSNQITRH